MESLGLAIDVGTTNLVMELVDLRTGMPLDEASRTNPQVSYGASVTDRIAAASTALGNMGELLGKGLCALAGELLGRAGLECAHVDCVSLCGNTAMEYIALGIDPGPLGVAPYAMSDPLGRVCTYEPFAFGNIAHGNVYFAPCIGAYVGGDASCGLLANGLPRTGENVLFVDLGTNGEIILAANGVITCCSVAAGPAFEALNGSSGTTLIDMVASALRGGMIDGTGRIREAAMLPVTQEDIRQLQLAKAAVCAGVRTLLFERRIDVTEVDAVIIAGLMGENLDVRSAATIGLIPPELITCARFVGNTAIKGARILLDEGRRAKVQRVIDMCEYLELSGRPGFNTRFISEMEFR